MNTTYAQQVEAIQKIISLCKGSVTPVSNNLLIRLNDAGSTIASLNISDPYKEIERLEADIRSYRNGHEINSKRYVEALQKIAELEKALAHYADVNQNQ